MYRLLRRLNRHWCDENVFLLPDSLCEETREMNLAVIWPLTNGTTTHAMEFKL